MSYWHCSVCGLDAEEDPLSWCGDPSCCSPSHVLMCSCLDDFVCVGDCAEEHSTDPDKG